MMRLIKIIFHNLFHFFGTLAWRVIPLHIKSTRTVIRHGDNVLLLRHYYGNRSEWMYPGGLIDWREDPETAAKREVWEEVGIKVDEVKFLKTYSHKRYAGNSTCHFFEVTVDSNEFTIDGVEIAEAAWFQLNDLPEPMTQPIFEV